MIDDRILLSIIIPTLNEADTIVDTLSALPDDSRVEIIISDGGSCDATCSLAKPRSHKLIHSESGRALQMNCGAEVASGRYLLFLHADTQLPQDFLSFLMCAEQQERDWGFFRVSFTTNQWLLNWVARLMNIRSRMTRIATGDQAIFLSRDYWTQLGGFEPIPLMEDVELCKRLRKMSSPYVMKQPLKTSSRRWETSGIKKTILLMWRLRLLYFLGVKPERLAKAYR